MSLFTVIQKRYFPISPSMINVPLVSLERYRKSIKCTHFAQRGTNFSNPILASVIQRDLEAFRSGTEALRRLKEPEGASVWMVNK